MGKRAPELFQKTFYAQNDRFPFREIVMRELCGEDEITIGAWADQEIKVRGLDTTTGKGRNAADDIITMESVRCSIVSVDGVEVNKNGAPYTGMDKWSRPVMRHIGAAFRELNGVEDDEVKKFLTGKPPTTETTPGNSNPDTSAAARSVA